MVLIMSTIMNMEFVHALNPLYAFPIVAVILCAFIVYAFGFRSPVQPPSFDAIEEVKKITKKRKTKESNKVKIVQNGKLNGSNLSKNQVSVSNKKKDAEKALPIDKTAMEKSSNEKKMTKKSKSSEKKISQEKKKDIFPQEDAGEGGWVQLISKKGRKNRKRDETTNFEKQTCIVKPVQNLQTNKSDEVILSEETPKANVIENSVPEKQQLPFKDEADETIPKTENKEKIIIIEDCKTVDPNIQKIAFEENEINNEKVNDEKINNGRVNDEATTKSKKKKKKNTETNTNSNDAANHESTAAQVISEVSAPLHSTSSPSVCNETSDILIGKTEVNHSKENKTSNVVFDELAGLYPEPKEQRKKKRVRRDH